MQNLALLVLGLGVATAPQSDEAVVHEPLRLVTEPVETEPPGWSAWMPFFRPNPLVSEDELRFTALEVSPDGAVWAGNRYGVLLRFGEGTWTLEVQLEGQPAITGIAFQGDRIWLSTSEGLVRLLPEGRSWIEKRFRERFVGEPLFVSGAYVPAEDGVQPWGRVDGVFMPSGEDAWGPFAISNDHGLYVFQSYFEIWHHFLPHFWGANSDWLDTRDLLPLRRPTCMAETECGDVWIGSEGDGLVRLRARGLRYGERDADEAAVDPSVIERHDAGRVGQSFELVRDLLAARDGGLWALLEERESVSRLAHFDGTEWEAVPLRWPSSGPVSRVNDMVEPMPGRLLLATSTGLMLLDTVTGTVTRDSELDHTLERATLGPDGTPWLSGGIVLYQGRPLR